MQIKKRDGSFQECDTTKIINCVNRACEGLEDVSAERVAEEAIAQLYNGMSTNEIDRALVLAARQLIVDDPNYAYVAARLLAVSLYKEAFGESVQAETFEQQYKDVFISNLMEMVKAERISPDLIECFDLDALADAIKPERDRTFKYLGLQTLYDRYFIHINQRRMETPQAFWMRVAMGICLNEDEPTTRAIEAYELMSQYLYCPGTPTLFNSGTLHSQLSSCYLSTFEDSIDGIFGNIAGQARLSKHAGGLGNDFTPLRGMGAYIKGTNGEGQGVIPWMKVYNDMLVSVNQGGKRKGAGSAYLETWHIDIKDFLELRKNTGDERRRCHDMNTANWIPDLFMEFVEQDQDWYLFSPDECPLLHETYGDEFTVLYWEMVEKAEAGKLRNFEKVKAKDLWKRMLAAIFETGHPWICWKDPSNLRYSNKHEGVVHSSNLCCVSGNERVATENGLIKARDLEDYGWENELAGREGQVTASAMELTIPNSPMVRVVTKEGYSHVVTPDHPLWKVNVGWTEAQDLKNGDRVELQQTFGMWGQAEYAELGLLAGLIAGDGTYGESSVHIDLWDNKTSHMKDEVQQAVHDVLRDHSGCYQLKTTSSDKPEFSDGTEGKLRLSSSPLAQVLASYGFNRETKLSVPEFVWRGTKETVSAYLRGLFACDATIQAEAGQMTTVSLASVSRSLLEEVQILLINAGVKSRIRDLHPGGPRMMPDGNGGTKEYECNPTFRLLITSTRSCKKFEEMTGFGQLRGHEVFLENLKKEGYSEKLWGVVDRVEECEPEDAYCLMVFANDRAWTCNGLLTKNTEILLHTKPSKYEDGQKVEVGETAVCNLGSINIAAHANDQGKVDYERLKDTVRKAVRLLDNVIDLNFYPTQEAEQSNLLNRPVGLGLMGWHDLLHKCRYEFGSEDAVSLASWVQGVVSCNAIEASARLARERGYYPTFIGSEWHNGRLPIDTYVELMNYRGKEHQFSDAELSEDYPQYLRQVVSLGMRNSNVMAIAPTATISFICGCSQSIEPDFSMLYTYSTLSGEFTMFNEYFVKRLKEQGLWGPHVAEWLKQTDGDIKDLPLPEEIKREFRTAFDQPYQGLIDMAAARQVWIDQGQSLNLYYAGTSLKELNDMYFYAWKAGLKTTYYLRTKAASKVEKSVGGGSFTLPTTPEEPVKQCRIDNPECEACQ